MRPNKTETAIQRCKTVFFSLAANDSVNNFGGFTFARGCPECVFESIEKKSTAWVRGDCYPRYVEVVTRFPVSGNSMAVVVDQWRGRVNLSIGLIDPEDRYVKTIYQIA